MPQLGSRDASDVQRTPKFLRYFTFPWKRREHQNAPCLTDDQIRVKAHGIAKEYPWRSPDENWLDAKAILAREYSHRRLLGFWRWTGIPKKTGWDLLTGLSAISLPLVAAALGIHFTSINNEQQRKIEYDTQKDLVVREYVKQMATLLLSKEFPLLSSQSKPSQEALAAAQASTLTVLAQLKAEPGHSPSDRDNKVRIDVVLRFLRKAGLLEAREGGSVVRSNILGPKILADADLGKVGLQGANLVRADLNSSDLSYSDLTEADLTEADLSNATLFKTILTKAQLSSVKLVKATAGGSAQLDNADLTGADLTEAFFRGVNLKDAKLPAAILRKANLNGANLNGANLNGADLSGADLTEADLSGADLTEADLSGADLSGANLTGADVRGAILNNTTCPDGRKTNTGCPLPRTVRSHQG